MRRIFIALLAWQFDPGMVRWFRESSGYHFLELLAMTGRYCPGGASPISDGLWGAFASLPRSAGDWQFGDVFLGLASQAVNKFEWGRCERMVSFADD